MEWAGRKRRVNQINKKWASGKTEKDKETQNRAE